MQTKIKVNRVRLIEAIEAKQVTERQTYERELAAATKGIDKVLEREAQRVEKEAAKQAAALRAYRVEDGYNETYENLGWAIRNRLKLPQEPKETERALQQLRMSDEETISLSAEDFARYM